MFDSIVNEIVNAVYGPIYALGDNIKILMFVTCAVVLLCLIIMSRTWTIIKELRELKAEIKEMRMERKV